MRADYLARLAGKIESRQAVIGIVGVGYVGLPLALAFCDAGFTVLAFDHDEQRIATIEAGRSPIMTVDSSRVAKHISAGTLTPHSQPRALSEPDVVIVCVPTPLDMDGRPDLAPLRLAAVSIGTRIHAGRLIVLESTSYPGTTRTLFAPLVASHSLLQQQEEIFFAYSPEREDPGNKEFNTSNTPKLVGALDDQTREVAAALYDTITQVQPVASVEIAEAAKVLENTYRAVNIALVNELKIVFDRMGIDAWAVIDAAATKPFGYQPFYPGPGVGGHCIPVDPVYLSWAAQCFDCRTELIDVATKINADMPAYVVSQIADALNKRKQSLNGASILVVGAAYKANVGDVRESPSLEVINQLRERGAAITVVDPFVDRIAGYDWHYATQPAIPLHLSDFHCAVILTAHSGLDYGGLALADMPVIDTRRALGTRLKPS